MTPSAADRASSGNGRPLWKMNGHPMSEQSCTPAMKHQCMMLVLHSEWMSSHKYYFVTSPHTDISTLSQSALSLSLSCNMRSFCTIVKSSHNLSGMYLLTFSICHVISSLNFFNSDAPQEAHCCSHTELSLTFAHPQHFPHHHILLTFAHPQHFPHHHISLTLAHTHLSHHLTHPSQPYPQHTARLILNFTVYI